MGRDRRAPRGSRDFLLLAILILATAVRLWGIGDRLPDPTIGLDPVDDSVVDETDRRTMEHAWGMWHGGTTSFDPNPHTGDWPGLPFYLTLFFQVLSRAVFALTTGSMRADEFARHVLADARSFFLLPRIGTALIGVLTVWLTYRVGRRYLGRDVGLIAALLLALNATHVLFSQHIADPNLLALLFGLLSAGPLVALAGSGSPRTAASAGARIGLAGACKYVPLAFLGSLALAVFEWYRSAESPAKARFRRGGVCLLAGVAGAVVAFLIVSPYTLLDWNRTLVDLRDQQVRHRNEWVGLSTHGSVLVMYLTGILPSMLGWPAYLLSLMGLGMLVAKDAKGRILASLGVIFLLTNGVFSIAQPRFILPALPFLYLAAGFAAVRIGNLLGRRLRGGRLGPAVVAPLLLLLVAWPLRDLLAERRELSRPDSRHAARRWILAHVPPDRPVAFDTYGPMFNTLGRERAAVAWPFFVSETWFVEAAYEPAWLAGIAYYAASEGVSSRFLAEQSTHRREASFYRWLERAGRVVWDSKGQPLGGPRIRIFALPDSVSTGRERTRLWGTLDPSLRVPGRLSKWCSEMAQTFVTVGRYDLGEEWARRGLAIGTPASRRDLLLALTVATFYRGELDSVLAATQDGTRLFPNEAAFHFFRAMALDLLGRRSDAVAQYKESLRIDPRQAKAAEIRSRIEALEVDRAALPNRSHSPGP